MSDHFLFAVLPYVSVTVFLAMTIRRYQARTSTYSALSSQFLENRQHFWGSIPFHYGLLVVLAGHLVAFLLPDAILGWNAAPLRLVLLEITALAMAILALVGLVCIAVRGLRYPLARRVTNAGDWFIYCGLGLQIGLGIWIAIAHGWGSSWFATSMAPWLWSLVKLHPDVSYVAPMPLAVKLHIINAFLIIGILPFTRLVHVLVVPNPYLWRRAQVVLWNRDPKGPRAAK